MTKFAKKALLATTLSVMVLAGCAQTPQTSPAPAEPAAPAPAIVVSNPSDLQPTGGTPPVVAYNEDCRFIAFTADLGWQAGLFLYDDQLKEVWNLNQALAGLNLSGNDLRRLEPYAFADGKVLFQVDGQVFYYDLVTEERVTVAVDADTDNGQPVVTAHGEMLAYINTEGNVVLKLTDGAYFTKTRVLTKIAAEADFVGSDVSDIDLSGDGRWLVLNIRGMLYMYDVANPRLFQLLPLSSLALMGVGGAIGDVAISQDGRHIAFTAAGRLLVLDRQSGYIDTVPYTNMEGEICNPVFVGGKLLFEIDTPNGYRIWKYDIATEQIRMMVVLNNTLGERGQDNLISEPNATGIIN